MKPAYLAALSLMSMASEAHAEPPVTCVSSYENAQVSRKNGAIVRARAELSLCVNACPEVLARDCATWLAETAPQIARVYLTLRRDDGAPLVSPRVFVDGFLQPGAGAGSAVELDPGAHEIRVESQGTAERRTTIQIGMGETKELAIQLPRLAPLPPPSEKVVTTSPPAYPFAIGGVGLGLALLGGALGIAGHVEKDALGDPSDGTLDDGCAPQCDPSDVERIRAEWIAGGVIAGVGVLTLGTATILLITADPIVVEGNVSTRDVSVTMRF
jgi:hypothetical protein